MLPLGKYWQNWNSIRYVLMRRFSSIFKSQRLKQLYRTFICLILKTMNLHQNSLNELLCDYGTKAWEIYNLGLGFHEAFYTNLSIVAVAVLHHRRWRTDLEALYYSLRGESLVATLASLSITKIESTFSIWYIKHMPCYITHICVVYIQI